MPFPLEIRAKFKVHASLFDPNTSDHQGAHSESETARNHREREARLARVRAELRPDDVALALTYVRASELVRDSLRLLPATPTSTVSLRPTSTETLNPTDLTRAALMDYLERLSEQPDDRRGDEPDGEVDDSSPIANDTDASFRERQRQFVRSCMAFTTETRPTFLSHSHNIQWNIPSSYDTSCRLSHNIQSSGHCVGEQTEKDWVEQKQQREHQTDKHEKD
ncbi:hypothetical protein V5O48_014020 [Marasmius crinis-equi]|uniref:Uncharacterized protein n=1 Tax=Marasmius crinis-equi TaxID=585013 RepID=A0ABR3EYG8_9AGAR